MHLSFDFCDTRAREAGAKADAALLDNIRDQARRSEAAWRQLADTQQAIVTEREKRDREREIERSTRERDLEFLTQPAA
ncbi:MAG TPA: hypothetical protein VL094_10555 [Sphingomonadaceae bacterium]|nr:hypothetical protein [Sphingomonadaceae bacterium]